MGGLSPATLPAKQRAVKDLLPREVLEQTFLYLNREDVEAMQISCRYFLDIISAEGFGKLTPLCPLKVVQLIDDEIAIWRNGTAKRFDYDSEDVACWLRNTCVDSVDMTAFFVHYNWNAERALQWFIRHRSVCRVINVVVKLPLNDGALLEGFLRPDSSRHWTSVSLGGLRGNLPLTSSSLESVVHLSLLESPENTGDIQVTVNDVIRWLQRPVSPFIGAACRTLTLSFGNLDGGLQQLFEAIREKFTTAATSQEFAVTIGDVPEDFQLASAYLQAPFRQYNRHAGDLLNIEVQTWRDHSVIFIRRRRCP